MVFARNLVSRRAYFPPGPRSHSHKATGFSEYFQFLTLGHPLLDSSKRSPWSSPIQKTSPLVNKYIRPSWMGRPLFLHVSPFYLYAFRMHSSHLYAFVCMIFGAKSLKLLEYEGFESPFSHHAIPWYYRVREHDPPFVCIFVCIQNHFIHTISWKLRLQSRVFPLH